MNTAATIQRVHDLIIVGDPSAAVCAVGAGVDSLVVAAQPSRIDLLHRPFRVWVAGREHRAHALVIAAGDRPSPAVYRDWLAHDRAGFLVTDEDSTRTSVDGVFARGCRATRQAMAWLADRAEAPRDALIAA
jgi:NADH dehydrogenase FAD-containing subunit